ncbi:growth-regulating factor 8-like isoform X2 [Euphorbia lathyris]|uniref:growth-regulating factor 8-like isoform X2 n=1 Tax=Euphorbia lathyris TaxID=212925 RepID=UPI00331447C7
MFIMGTRGGVSSKAIDKAKDCDFGLGLRMQPNDSSIGLMSSSSSSSSLSGGGGGGGDGGAVFYSRSNRFGDIYDVVGSKSLQPFNSSEMTQCLNMNMRVPFTVAQWQELERQNIIYRYLMASIPVPAELLIPILRTQSNSNTSSPQSNVGKAGSLELGISSCNSDPEPWRCKRTDGKKWRCSRDVAPDQKYCERHSHKSRPRSRKPVELQSESMSMATNLLNQKSQFRSQPNSNFSIFSSSPGAAAMVSVPSSYDQSRNLDWFLKGETVPITSSNSNLEWPSLKAESTKCDENMYHFRESQHLDSNSYMGLRSNTHSLQTHRLNDNCSLLLSPTSASLSPRSHTQEAQETRHFLDVWSSAMRDSCSSVGGSPKGLPASSLSLSMAGGTGSEENENGEASSLRPGGGQWMSHGSSWLGSSSTPGGPLAEALCLGISSSAKDDSNFTSSHGSSSYGNTSGGCD